MLGGGGAPPTGADQATPASESVVAIASIIRALRCALLRAGFDDAGGKKPEKVAFSGILGIDLHVH